MQEFNATKKLELKKKEEAGINMIYYKTHWKLITSLLSAEENHFVLALKLYLMYEEI
jgi:hypothetical protein